MNRDTAVIIIDVQRALCEGRWATHDAAGVIARLNDVTNRARAAAVPVIFVQHEEAGSELARSEPGWALAPELHVAAGDLHVHKQASDCFHDSGLHELLQARGVSHLVIGGMQSDFCVDSGVRRALALGYRVSLIADGHTTLANAVLSAEQIIAHHTLTLANIGSYGVRATPIAAAEIGFAA